MTAPVCRRCAKPLVGLDVVSATERHLGCLVEERDDLERCYREAVAGIAQYAQAGGPYAHLFLGGESLTREAPRRLVEHFEKQIDDLLAALDSALRLASVPERNQDGEWQAEHDRLAELEQRARQARA